MEITLTVENFDNEVLKSPVPVLVDFWAEWCGPCKMLSPILEEIAIECRNRLKIGKINVDEQPQLAQAFRIESIPTILVFKGTTVTAAAVGLRSKQDILKMLNI